MRVANVNGRLTLMTPTGGGVDVETTSRGRFAADPQAVFAHWSEFRAWAAGATADRAAPVDERDLGPPALPCADSRHLTKRDGRRTRRAGAEGRLGTNQVTGVRGAAGVGDGGLTFGREGCRDHGSRFRSRRVAT